jgi:hypothetical protein
MLLELLINSASLRACPWVRGERRTDERHQDAGEERRTAAASGQEGVRADPARAAHDAGLDVGDVGSERYHHALGYLREQTALVGDQHTATEGGAEQDDGYALYFFTRRAVKLLEG